MIKAFLSIKKLKSGSTFSSWLWRIIKNEFLQFVRKPDNRKMVFAEDLPFSDVGIEEESEKNLIKEEQEKTCEKSYPQLSIVDQEVLALIEFQEINYDEAAEILGVSLNTLKSRIRRARIN